MDWAGDMDWGTVPGWLGAGSLILAFVIFRRDRRNAERSQVDLVGAWGEGAYELVKPGEGEDSKATISMHLRNASELPVVVRQLAYEVHWRWLLRVKEHPVAPVHDEGDAAKRGFFEDVQLAPGETKDLTSRAFDLSRRGSRKVVPFGGVTVQVSWLLMIDNAGRRWVVKPNKGSRATRVRRWWRPGEYMPHKW